MNNPINIISTASLPEECLQQLQKHGINAEVIPFIRTYSAVTATNIQRIRSFENYAATAVFTSAHGVEAVAECLLKAPSWKFACTSGQTKKAVEWYFDEKDIVASAPNAGALAEELMNAPLEPILFFCGNRRLDTLPERLRSAGIRLEEIEVYKTELTPQEVTSKQANAILFFSTTAVESFFMLNVVPKEAVCFAIGDTTAEALQKKVSNEIIVAEKPGKKELIDLVIKHYYGHS